MMKKITFLLNSPFLDKIPSLKSLITYLAQQGHDITIITTKDEKYLVSHFRESNITQILVKRRTRKVELPTSVKLIFKIMKHSLCTKTDYYIGGDGVSNRLLYYISKFISIRKINFLLEYPNLKDHSEMNILQSADYIITHDKWHGDFLVKNFSVQQDRLLFLPNATSSPEKYDKSTYFYDKLNISRDRHIILHSGGLGDWFCCKDLAKNALGWDPTNVLVFHTSLKTAEDEYYLDMKENVASSENIFFSTQPVDSSMLDELVGSAYIGIATYSVDVLGYRALYMGLAAGKIGNYLKCGVPVIATRLPSLDYIENYECGILVDDLCEIEDAISKIGEKYESYSKNAHKCYQELWESSRYLKRINDKISEK